MCLRGHDHTYASDKAAQDARPAACRRLTPDFLVEALGKAWML